MSDISTGRTIKGGKSSTTRMRHSSAGKKQLNGKSNSPVARLLRRAGFENGEFFACGDRAQLSDFYDGVFFRADVIVGEDHIDLLCPFVFLVDELDVELRKAMHFIGDLARLTFVIDRRGFAALHTRCTSDPEEVQKQIVRMKRIWRDMALFESHVMATPELRCNSMAAIKYFMSFVGLEEPAALPTPEVQQPSIAN